LGVETPVYFSRFHPYFKMKDVPATPLETLITVFEIAKDAGVLYTYLGNVPHAEYENTICPSCKNILVTRHSFTAEIIGLANGKCTRCDASIPIVYD
jgi:pyruvate formate lyase activating enzyme